MYIYAGVMLGSGGVIYGAPQETQRAYHHVFWGCIKKGTTSPFKVFPPWLFPHCALEDPCCRELLSGKEEEDPMAKILKEIAGMEEVSTTPVTALLEVRNPSELELFSPPAGAAGG